MELDRNHVATVRQAAFSCGSAALEETGNHGRVLTPGRYIGAKRQPDDGKPFRVNLARRAAQWREPLAVARLWDAAISEKPGRAGVRR